MAPQKFCVGTQFFLLNCGYLKFVGTQNLNFVGTQICGYLTFVGAQNLFILKTCGNKICGYSKKSWVLKFVGIHTQKFIDTQILGHFHLWVLIFVGTQNL